mgnify:FL=1
MFSARKKDNYEGFTIEFTNGWTVSVQFGKHTYSNRRHNEEDKSTAEIAAYTVDGEWFDFDTTTKGKDYVTSIKGWQSSHEVVDFMNMIRALPDIYDGRVINFTPDLTPTK